MKVFDFSTDWWQFVLMAVVSYLIGCFNFAVVIAKLKHKDIRKIGSGNPGTMNMSREFGAWVGIVTFLLDAFKGGIPAVISFFIYRNTVFAGTGVAVSDVTRFFCGMFVIIGHVFPVTMRFKGGKGVASTLGLMWLCVGTENPWFLLIGAGIMLTLLVTITLIKYGSLCSLVYVAGMAAWQVIILLQRYPVFSGYVVWALMMIFAVVLLVWVSHRKNLIKIFSGEEHVTSFFKKKKKKTSALNKEETK
ncbi:MAG: glycerol-3-phosphate acyltransferase [Clostridia bacterium]|nr:glycerol-3-phosphate acyltransferase [Clostridia bacterium]